MYTATHDSISAHQAPDWFHDAKLGIFVHWGLYSVPGWAPHNGNPHDVVARDGWGAWFAATPMPSGTATRYAFRRVRRLRITPRTTRQVLPMSTSLRNLRRKTPSGIRANGPRCSRRRAPATRC